jgi:hypothetical protein
VGRCTLTPPDPQLKGAWFQTLTLEYQSWFQNVPFKFNLRRYTSRRRRCRRKCKRKSPPGLGAGLALFTASFCSQNTH